jgi:parvulin-like peptidyl-prolyl isomerase
VARGELTAEIDKAVFSLPVGTVSDPIPTKFGWHLVKVIEKIPVSYKPFADVKAQLLKREQDTQFQKKLAEYLAKIKREAVIRVSPEGQAYYTPAVAAAASTPDSPSASPPTKR